MTRPRPSKSIALICGGPSSEREVSLKSAAQVVKSLPEDYAVTIVEIQADGKEWRLTKRREPKHLRRALAINSASQQPSSALAKLNQQVLPSKIADSFDVAFLVTHGEFGEDGHLQAILDVAGIPYTGSGLLASALAMNKAKTKEFLAFHRIKSPPFIVLRRSDATAKEDAARILDSVGVPCVVKPNQSGSSLGITIVESIEKLEQAIAIALAEGTQVLVEEYVQGKELTCGVLGNSEDPELMALPIVEIFAKGRFFDYDSKYRDGQAEEICPANIDTSTTQQVQDIAKAVHRALGCDGLTRSDFILADNGVIYFLEINTLPGMTETSLCPKEALAAGMSFPEFLEAQIQLALRKSPNR